MTDFIMSLPSLPEAAPIESAMILVDLACGITLIMTILDIVSMLKWGYLGATAAINVVIMCLSLPFVFGMSILAPVGHWVILFTIALCVYALFTTVATNMARRIAGIVVSGTGVFAVWQLSATLNITSAHATFLGLFPDALLLGAAVAGMLLGHWYLIAPDLSFRPLRFAVYIVFAAIAIKIISIATVMVTNPGARTLLISSSFSVPFWLLVVGTGLIFTAVVNGLTFYFALMRANQPATAMLYALIISVLMGVIPAQMIFFSTGIPI